MKEYTVKLRAVSEKVLKIDADSAEEALDMSFDICNHTDAIQFDNEDVVSLDGELVKDGHKYDECSNCIHSCSECGGCLLDECGDEEDADDDDCGGCCPECGACLCEKGGCNSGCGEENGEEFELRKDIFKDYLNNVYEEIVEYANVLFGIEG